VTTAELARAYGAAAGAWAAGPERTYAALAAALVDRSPVPLAGRRVADVGTGTGVASRVLAARGAVPYGLDVSLDMLRHGRADRPPGAVADALALPFRDGVLGGAAYAFCLNHLADPVAALREAARVLAPGGVVLGAVFATGWDHPAKAEADAVLRAHGWRRPGWYGELKDDIEPLLSSAERFDAAATAAGLVSVSAVEVAVETGVAAPRDLAAWRLGMAAVAPYVAALAPGERAALVADVERAVTPAPLRPAVVLLTALRP
jgi:ubiquinone/menaquinone biosynthesis C-methylase UbiE